MNDKETQVKTEIIQAARKLFWQHGLHKTTMGDIGEALGKGRKYAYYYYSNKEEIFAETINAEAKRILSIITDAVQKKATAAEKVYTFFTIRFNEVRKTAASTPVMLAEAKTHLPMVLEAIKENNTVFTKVLEQLFLQGIQNGEFKSIKSKECHLMAIAGMALLNGAESDMAISGELPSDELRCDVLIRTFIRGLR